jgi:hypothetical protein
MLQHTGEERGRQAKEDDKNQRKAADKQERVAEHLPPLERTPAGEAAP